MVLSLKGSSFISKSLDTALTMSLAVPALTSSASANPVVQDSSFLTAVPTSVAMVSFAVLMNVSTRIPCKELEISSNVDAGPSLKYSEHYDMYECTLCAILMPGVYTLPWHPAAAAAWLGSP